MRRAIINFLLLITFFVLQGTLFKAFDFGNISPNLCLILVVSLGLMRGKKTGLLSGFFAGLLFDIFLGSYIGFYALVLMYIGYFSGAFNKVFFPEDVKLPIAMIAISDLLYGIMCYCFMFLLRGQLKFGYYFTHICVPECVYTMVITILVYPLILGLDNILRKLERKQERTFV